MKLTQADYADEQAAGSRYCCWCDSLTSPEDPTYTRCAACDTETITVQFALKRGCLQIEVTDAG